MTSRPSSATTLFAEVFYKVGFDRGRAEAVTTRCILRDVIPSTRTLIDICDRNITPRRANRPSADRTFNSIQCHPLVLFILILQDLAPVHKLDHVALKTAPDAFQITALITR